jgi:propionyl-CoA carboxylase beta chain
MNPYVAAKAGFVDDVIAFDDVRLELIRSLELLISKQETRIERKHGNVPL